MEDEKRRFPPRIFVLENNSSKISLSFEGWDGKGDARLPKTTARNETARVTRAPRRMPRDWLPTDAGRRLWIGAVGGSSRSNGGDTQGEGRIGRLTWRHGVGDARGTPWTLGTDGNTPGGNIYRVSRFEHKFEEQLVLQQSFLQGDGLRMNLVHGWEFNFDQVEERGEWKWMFYGGCFSWRRRRKDKCFFFIFTRREVEFDWNWILLTWKRGMFFEMLFRNFVKIYPL